MTDKKPLNEFLMEEADRIEAEENQDTQVSTDGDNAPETVSTQQEEDAPQGEAAQPSEEAEQPLVAPQHWDDADKETFSSLPRAAQEWALKRDKAIEATITRKTQEVAEQRKAVEPLLAATKQHEGYLKSIGIPAELAFSTLVATERLLRTGTQEQKANAIAKLISDYGIQLESGAAQPQNNNTQPDNRLAQEVQDIRRSLDGMTRQTVASQVEAFAATKDQNGQPLYPHFDKVRVKMGQMVAGGDDRPLPELYADAIWSVPEVREEMLEAQRQSAATAQTQKARDAAAAARKANAINVKPNGSDGGAKPKLNLREEIEKLADGMQ